MGHLMNYSKQTRKERGEWSMKDFEFRSIHIDLEKDVFEVNDKSIKDLPITELSLIFDGFWKLSFKQEYHETKEKNSN